MSAPRRSALWVATWRKRCCISVTGPPSPSSTSSTWPRSAVRGVRSSCETIATNSSFMRSTAFRSVTSRAMTT